MTRGGIALVLVVTSAFAPACGGDDVASTPDAGPPQGGLTDGGGTGRSTDAGRNAGDAGPASTSTASADAAASSDAGAPILVPDAGPGDAAPPRDAAAPVDSGPACPVAVATVTEGNAVIPQTTLHLIGSASHGGSGMIETYAWTATVVPDGVQPAFSPGASLADTTFEVNAAGTYEFSLEVTDSLGVASCEAATLTVVVTPDQRLHVELLWTTPGDADETDEGPNAGADLDLHFAHPYASQPDRDGDGVPDPWFDIRFDCFWLNSNPEWGSAGIDDNPTLDRDDVDGAGPENVNLTSPENASYAIGVHYWDDHGFGPSLATVRVYVDGVLVYTAPETRLLMGDMWRVASLSWNDSDPVVTPSTASNVTATYCPDTLPSACP